MFNFNIISSIKNVIVIFFKFIFCLGIFLIPNICIANDSLLTQFNYKITACRDLYTRAHYEQAENECKSALQIANDTKSDELRCVTLNLLGLIKLRTGSIPIAADNLSKAYELSVKSFGERNIFTAKVADNLGLAYLQLGKIKEATNLFKSNIEIFRKEGPENLQSYATGLNNYALGLFHSGRVDESLSYFSQAITLTDEVFGKDSYFSARVRTNAAELLSSAGRYDDAEPLVRAAIQILLKLFPQTSNPLGHPDLAFARRTLGTLLSDQERYIEAIYELEKAEKILSNFQPKSIDHGAIMNNLAIALENSGSLEASLEMYKKALDIAYFTGNPSAQATIHDHLARVFTQLRRCKSAKKEHKFALSLAEKTYGANHYDTAITLSNYALYEITCGSRASAIELYRRSINILNNQIFDLIVDPTPTAFKRLNRISPIYRAYINLLLDSAINNDKYNNNKQIAESFVIGQNLTLSNTATEVSRLGARLSVRNDELGSMIRKYQDLVRRVWAIEAQLIKEHSRSNISEKSKNNAQLSEELDKAKKELSSASEQVDSSYWSLIKPQALAPTDVQQLLGVNEALVVFIVDKKHSIAWVVRPKTLEVRILRVGREKLTTSVTQLRVGLDPTTNWRSIGLTNIDEDLRSAERLDDGRSVVNRFDVDKAHQLYNQIWAPIKSLLQGAKHVIVVPDGPLESLPLQVLVTETPATELRTPKELRSVKWLALNNYAISLLPSVNSLRSFRDLALKSDSGNRFIGFGDPEIGDKGAINCTEEIKIGELRSLKAPEIEISELFRGGGWHNGFPIADVGAVRSLPRLPLTRCELLELSKHFSTDKRALYLDKEATETTVKKLSNSGELKKAGIITFATHGLLGGEFKGLDEPALVLSPPKKVLPNDDGLLTASEVAQLDLNAELIILSACNTAASDGNPQAEGFSGLAKAFFYAGTRTLLVSHWSVYSKAAVDITTGMIEHRRKMPSIVHSEALRRTMRDLIEYGSNPHPSYWAPFTVVGGVF